MGRVLELAKPNRRPIPAADSHRATVDDQQPRGQARAAAARLGLAALLAAILLSSAVTACRSGRGSDPSVAVLPPAALPTPVPEPSIVTPVATATPPAVESTLELADRAFDAGDWVGARAGYESHLAGLDAAVDADRALYRLAILSLAKDAGGRDAATGYSLLRRLVREHADSPYRMEAELILGLNARVDGLETEVEKLESQLEALKRIDLERSQQRRSP